MANAGSFKKGEKRPNQGKRGPNKSTLEIKALAQEHGATAISTLAKLAAEADSDAAKIAACKELLDRGYGKASQAITGADGSPLMPPVIQFVLDADSPQ